MKFVILFSIVLFLQICKGQHFLKYRHGIPPAGPPRTKAVFPDWGWITQRVDHFDPSDLRTWEMRYLNNSQFFQPGGPIFIFLGGEWEISEGYLMTGQLFDMAEEHGGYMFYTEHRYYGQSYPTEDVSTENLQYLNADQALADLAYFIDYKKKTIPGLENSKVVVVGGSYSATLATWARLKYPHLVDAALSSSAPLRAVADFYEYFEVVNENLNLASQECVNTIKEAVRTIEEYLETQEGVANVSSLFGTCSIIDVNEPERSYFFNSLANPFAGLVQYAYVGQLSSECDRLQAFPGSSIEKLSAYIKDYYGGYCISDYKFFVDYYNTSEIRADIYRQWYYQTCTEYGFYQTSNSENQPFGQNFGLDLSIQRCKDLFGYGEDVLNSGIERTNLLYGSIKPEVTKVVSVHGTVDPWHAIGALEDINPLAPVIVVNGTSHCGDLGSITDLDISEMREAKLRVKQLISEWIR